ncbi:MAG: hypothetical protein ACAI18_04705 [Gemmatimonadales bacterium]
MTKTRLLYWIDTYLGREMLYVMGVVLVLFLIFIWPTPYTQPQGDGFRAYYRINRFTGEVQSWSAYGWGSRS